MKKRSFLINGILCFILVSLAIVSFSFSSLVTTTSASNKAIYKGNPLNNKVSLMINVYWGDEYIIPMLDTLDKYGVKTTFFIGGSWASKSDKLLREINSRGHEIANHGYLHKDHDKISDTSQMREIKLTEDLIANTIGVKTNLFAPPSGAFNNKTLEIASSLGYKTIMWSKDTIDWRDQNTELIYTRCTKNVEAGDLILMHPTKCTMEALPKILDYYKQNNINVGTVSEVIKV